MGESEVCHSIYTYPLRSTTCLSFQRQRRSVIAVRNTEHCAELLLASETICTLDSGDSIEATINTKNTTFLHMRVCRPAVAKSINYKKQCPGEAALILYILFHNKPIPCLLLPTPYVPSYAYFQPSCKEPTVYTS